VYNSHCVRLQAYVLSKAQPLPLDVEFDLEVCANSHDAKLVLVSEERCPCIVLRLGWDMTILAHQRM
jgi:hypothetical protein